MRPDDRKYLDSHEWAKLEGDLIVVGITDFAVEELSNGNEGDLVYCDLPEVGREVEQGCTSGRRVGQGVDALLEADQLTLLEPEHLAALGPLKSRVADLGADPLHLTLQGVPPGGRRGRPQMSADRHRARR
mgnify:CR=1 FL=1